MKTIALLAAVPVLFCGCVIIPPRLELTGAQTQLEKQIVGDYRELEDDAWVASTMKTNLQRDKVEGNFSSDEKIMAAKNVIEMNAERIQRYRREHAAGESYAGMLKYFPTARYENDKSMKEELMRIIETENTARSEIIKYNASASGKTDKEESILYGAMQRRKAGKGEWIEISEGKWVKKK